MLHSALPRTFLPPPGLCYLGGYYGETVHSYSSVSRFVPLDSSYIPDHQVIAAETRPASPIPLDLSLKPSSTPHSSRTDDSETIEVDDIEDRRDVYDREKKYYNWESRYGTEDHHSPVARAYHYYDSLRRPESQDLLYSSEMSSYQSPSSSPIPSQKLLLTSPSTLRSMQSYQQQLLLTPQHHLQSINAPMTPPSTPSPPQCPRRRTRDEEESSNPSSNITPTATTPKTSTAEKINSRPKKKHARRLKFDEDTSSPVSGTVILGPDEAVVTGDIDPAFNIVEVTEEARAELAKIENRLGPYQCKLCRQLHEDAFQLAQHRCSRIAHVEYRCPECDKRFSCPANLASHRRWHKPRMPSGDASSTTVSSNSVISEISCSKCEAKFTRQAALRKHLTTQHPETNNNIPIINNNNSINNNNINNNNNDQFNENDTNILPRKTTCITTGMQLFDGKSPHG
ncbi:asparagine-rich zinc finger protein AZF1-like [Chelonus insularis]|uniref:asparagine-rich zinc finger protein AZF1-like n=1 Tax=Chelonus insularis TaxID=460826 RepID=UPI00158EC652|nr:asparagine-rich zinc finger protein AZF1-like [Chelonus insularis]